MITKEQIIEDVNETYEKKRKVFPCTSNRASAIGDPCIRKLVYYRTEWSKQQLPTLSLQKIFDEGNHQEEFVKKKLMEADYVIHEAQRSIIDNLLKKYNISGHIDFFITKDEQKPVLCEVKSMSPNIFMHVDTIFDLDKYPWTKKYYSQIQIYMFASDEEQALLILKNKSTGDMKILDVSLDLNHVESLLKKSEEVNNCVNNETLPDRIENRSICEKCDFQHICVPDIINDSAAIIEDPEFEDKLQLREELKEYQSEFKEIDKDIKDTIKGLSESTILVGDFQIEKSEYMRKNIEVPESMKDEYTVEKLCTKINIKKLSKEKQHGGEG
jgi:CRISPR/Cas system-associated exonuclease Cas4 (RecB family)